MTWKQIFKLLFTRMLPVVSVGATLWVLLFSNSCANTTTPPSGGPKDTIPPFIRKVDSLE